MAAANRKVFSLDLKEQSCSRRAVFGEFVPDVWCIKTERCFYQAGRFLFNMDIKH